MKRWIQSGVLVLCVLLLIACGNPIVEGDTYTKDAQVEETKQEEIVKEDPKETTNEPEAEVANPVEPVESKSETQDKQSPPVVKKGEDTTSNTTTTPPPIVEKEPVEQERIAKLTISIDTKTLLNNMDNVAKNKQAYVPSDGWILAPITVEIQEGDTVFDVLSRVSRERRIHMEYQGVNQNIYDSVYIQGIGQLYEFDCGELSGWMYTINGAYVSKGASGVKAEDGMRIEWRYTCDLGRDLGL